MTSPQEDVLAELQAIVDSGDGGVSAATTVFQTARESSDRINWLVGDAANILMKAPRYGKKAVRQAAKDSNYDVSTVYERAAVARFYPQEARDLYAAEPALSYSHLRTAMKLKVPKLVNEFLLKAAELAFTVEECRIELLKEMGKPVPPVKIFEGEMCVHRVAADGQWSVSFDERPDLIPGKVYKACFYEVAEG